MLPLSRCILIFPTRGAGSTLLLPWRAVKAGSILACTAFRSVPRPWVEAARSSANRMPARGSRSACRFMDTHTMPESIRLLIVDDHAVVRKGLVMVLRLEPGLDVIGEAENGKVGLEKARTLQPDIALVDLVMPEMDGQQMALALRKSNPLIKIMILTGTE